MAISKPILNNMQQFTLGHFKADFSFAANKSPRSKNSHQGLLLLYSAWNMDKNV
jgi:hypothetical protein